MQESRTNTNEVRQETKFERISEKITNWIGSPQSILVHTLFFIGIFALRFFDVSSSDVLLILTTLVSLEAIYLAIFIQMTVNQHGQELDELSDDVDEISEDVDEIQKDVEEISEEEEEETESRFEYIELILKNLLQEVKDLKKDQLNNPSDNNKNKK